MADEDDNSGSIDLARPKEEALRLKTLAVEKYNSGDLDSAVAFAERARDLHPSITGLREMLTAFDILRAASSSVLDGSKPTPDYYKILQVQRFAHINSIKKQYKKLALTLHPDKNPFLASEEAFKLVGEAARVLSDNIRRKEYDTRLRVSMQSEAAAEEEEEVDLGAEGAGETFWTSCSGCRLLHQFLRKYLGHNLMCPGCKKTFEAMEIEVSRHDEGKNEGVTRVSARILERVAKGEYVGSVEKFGLRVKKRNSSVAEVPEKSGAKVARTGEDGDTSKKKEERVEKSGRFKKMETLLNLDGVGRVGDEGKEAAGRDEVDIVENGGRKGVEGREEEGMTLTLFQMQMMVKKKNKKKKLVEVNVSKKAKEVNAEKSKVNEMVEEAVMDVEREREIENAAEEENVRKEERAKKKGANLREISNGRRVPKVRNLKAVHATSKNHLYSEIEKDRASEEGNLEVLLVEKEKEKDITMGKRERRRVTKYGNSDVLNIKSSQNHVDSSIEMLIANKDSDLEIMAVEDSDFHDFDKDRVEKSFKIGQVWAVYDDVDAMPRHYALINKIVSVNPFTVTLSWLQLQNKGEEELISWLEKGFDVSCGIFQVAGEVTVRYLNLFSHLVDCERAARELYRIYPKKGSIWAVYSSSGREAEERNERIENKRCYGVVVSLSSYSDLHGLSVAYLEKVAGFRTVFKRREIGPKAVICLKAKDMKIFSHQIPAKKLSGEESPALPKNCWELDPASLAPHLLKVS